MTLEFADINEDIGAKVSSYKPEIIALGLCKQRYQVLLEHKEWADQELSRENVLKRKELMSLVAQLFYISIEDRLAEMDVGIGPKIKTVVDTAKNNGVPIHLVDREIDITMKRLYFSLDSKERRKLGWMVRKELLGFHHKRKDTKELVGKHDKPLDVMISNFLEISPHAKKVMVDERLDYMHTRLKELSKDKKVLAVLNPSDIKALKGRQAQKTNLKELETLPSRSPARHLKFAIPILFLFFMLNTLFFGERADISDILMIWILMTSSLSALGAIVARAHPITILVTIALAPIMSMALIGSGWVGGLVELRIRRPRIGDIRELSSMDSINHMLKNRALRPFFVGLITNICNLIAILFVLPTILGIKVF